MPIQTFAFLNYYAIVVSVSKDSVFLLVPNLRFLLSKLGPLAKIELIKMKNGFSIINCRRNCQRPTEIFVFSKYHCTTLIVEQELDVSVCAQLKIFTHKNSFTWLYFTKTLVCILGPITCHRLTLKGKFFVSQEKAQGRTKNSLVMNLNVSANDINTFKV